MRPGVRRGICQPAQEPDLSLHEESSGAHQDTQFSEALLERSKGLYLLQRAFVALFFNACSRTTCFGGLENGKLGLRSKF